MRARGAGRRAGAPIGAAAVCPERPLGSRRHDAERCPACRLHLPLCACGLRPTLPTATKVVVVAHFRELRRPTATGPLALQALPHHELHISGDPAGPPDLAHLAREGRRVLVLFPGDDARVLTPALREEDPRPVTLVVPEGSWRQAARMARRLPGLEAAERVILPEGPRTAWGLRRETREGGLATLEAIARALGVLEGPEVRRALEGWFEEIVARTRRMRGARW